MHWAGICRLQTLRRHRQHAASVADRVEIHVDEQNASGGVTEASNNNPFDFGKVPQKPRF